MAAFSSKHKTVHPCSLDYNLQNFFQK